MDRCKLTGRCRRTRLSRIAHRQQSLLEPQQLQSKQEFQQRAQTVKQNADIMAMNEAANSAPGYRPGYRDDLAKGLSANYSQKEAPAAPQADADFGAAPAAHAAGDAMAREGEKPNTDINGVLMLPLWIDGELVFAHRVLVAGQPYVQGCLLDWPEIRGWLKGEIADLLPDAALVPAGVSDTAEESRLLAALPVRLVPGAVAVDGEQGWSPLMISLSAAWVCLLMTAAAIVGLLWGVIRLSARRASFVTAVTHELRTPLTTFQMYAEMLAEGMVPEESRRKEYLKTLRAGGGAADAFGRERAGLRPVGTRAVGPPAGNGFASRDDRGDARPPGRSGGTSGNGVDGGKRGEGGRGSCRAVGNARIFRRLDGSAGASPSRN